MIHTIPVDDSGAISQISHVVWEITPKVIEKLKQFGAVAAQIREQHPDTIEHVAFKLPGDLEGAFADGDEDDQPAVYAELVEFEFEDVFRVTGYVDEGSEFHSDLLRVSELAKLVEVADAQV